MEHFYKDVEGFFNFEELYTKMVNWGQDGFHFLEVGSWKGKSAAFMCVEIINSGKNIKFDCVDTFKGSLDEELHQNDPDVVDNNLFEKFIINMKPVDDHYNVIVGSSVEVSKQYVDGSLDFVNIDGAHNYDAVKEDIESWLPKVKKGGYLGGDDFHHPPLRQAVYDSLPHDKIQQVGNCWLYYKEEN